MTKNGLIYSNREANYVGHLKNKIFGKMNCHSSRDIIEENKVYFHEVKDAVALGYRPCDGCQPMTLYDFIKNKDMISYESLDTFQVKCQ